MSWSKVNLFNMHKHASSPPPRELMKTPFQLRHRAKQLSTAYHAGHISQHQLKRTFQPLLPRVFHQSTDIPTPPNTMLTFAYLERRLDVVMFRACFVPSIWDARYLVRTGKVTVNGRKCILSNYLLEDLDIVQVAAHHIRLLNPRAEKSTNEDTDDTSTAPSDDTQQASDDSSDSQRLPKNVSAFPSADLGFHPVDFMAPFIFIPEYLEVNFNNLTICLLRSPTIKPGRCEIPSPYDDVTHQRSFDYYIRFRRQK